ncbi:hypothetical protein ACFMPD_13975 [Sedimentitalea sp. HM32M-2]|uniref:hypothetical protein n=1 Tax=Sedimentitalea sp. HM32M-2 TaxID=3351566 RepID=UPI00363FB34D
MVHSNKILTVSYGTFSCTLEGFDDSFGTMKAIAEYFRDLASDDRYFGAEPPVPDAEMLARIAQRETSSSVQAQATNGGGILLRAARPSDPEHPSIVQSNEPATSMNGSESTLESAPGKAPDASHDRPEVSDDAAAPDSDNAPKAPEVDLPAIDRRTNDTTPADTRETPAGAMSTAAEYQSRDDDTGIAQADNDDDGDMAIEPALDTPQTSDKDPAEAEVTSRDFPAIGDSTAALSGTEAEEPDEPVDAPLMDGWESAIDAATAPQDSVDAAPETDADIETTTSSESADDMSDFFAGSDIGMAPDDETVSDDVLDASGETGAPEIAPKPSSFGESIAARLQRIRAVVSRSEPAAEPPEVIKNEGADAFIAQAAEDLTVALNADCVDNVKDREQSFDPGDVAGDELAGALRKLEADFAAEADDAVKRTDAVLETQILSDSAASSEIPDVESFASDETPFGQTDMAAAHGVGDADMDNDHGSPVFPELEESPMAQPSMADLQDTPPVSAPTATSDPDGERETLLLHNILAHTVDLDTESPAASLEDAPETAASPIADADPEDDAAIVSDDGKRRPDKRPRHARPRVIKVLKSRLEQAIATGDLEMVDQELDEPGSQDQLESADMTSDLLPEPDQNCASNLHQSGNSEPRRGNPDHPEASTVLNDEEDLTRLMARTDEEMSEPETTATRETYNRMRAAVVAAQAEGTSETDDLGVPDDHAYREDLANTIRPRRPVVSERREEKQTGETRPAPLKLIAEQRVDSAPATAQHGPVRPRRVACTPIENDTEASGVDGSFAQFAAEMGASGLPELLEAAAAYMSFVEGRAQFSRPQLMNKVRQIKAAGFNREDSLRSFGRLLREGKIEKTGGGRFAASGDIGFRPDERATG